jgi:hypothetical protein
VNIRRSEQVESELDTMIERRSRQKDPDEESELWQASEIAYAARRREEMRAAWCEHHQGQAARLRAVLEELIAGHEKQAERYREQPEGSTMTQEEHDKRNAERPVGERRGSGGGVSYERL